MNENTYLQQLIARQERAGWSHREMARQLGISVSSWSRIVRGERGMGISIIRRAMKRFPEYNAEALLFLLRNASESNSSVLEQRHPIVQSIDVQPDESPTEERLVG